MGRDPTNSQGGQYRRLVQPRIFYEASMAHLCLACGFEPRTDELMPCPKFSFL